MKAALFLKPGLPLQVQNVPNPKISKSEVLVEVKACGLCHSDIHIIEGKIRIPKVPMILGHEISGRVARVGPDEEQFRKGDRALVSGVLPCGHCRYCSSGRSNICANKLELGIHRDGGFAEFVAVPTKSLFRIPEEVSYDEAAILTDAIATPYHAMKRARVGFGDLVAIYGIGGLGLNAVQLARLSGCRVIAIDILPGKLDLAKELGAEETINSMIEDPVEKIKVLTDSEGVDVAMDFVGLSKTFEQATESVRSGGRVVLVGVGTDAAKLPMRQMTAKELTIFGVQAFIAHCEYPPIIEMVQKGRLNVKRMISHRFPLSDVNQGIDVLKHQIDNPLRVVIKP